jgi:protein-S-isoprenylcysteine O-methyltransferase Ste14
MPNALRRWLTFTAILTAGLLALTGRWLDPWVWAYIAVWSGFGAYAMFSIDEDLARERFHPPDAGADQLPLRFIRLLALAHLIVGALDSGRWHVAPVAGGLRIAGLTACLAASILVVRSMRANRFFSPVVRIQNDRGHRVISTGPYAHVRHPGYAGMILAILGSGLALGSWLSVAFAAGYCALILRRVVFEDGFLQTNLNGYREYSQRVRYRLIPGAF